MELITIKQQLLRIRGRPGVSAKMFFEVADKILAAAEASGRWRSSKCWRRRWCRSDQLSAGSARNRTLEIQAMENNTPKYLVTYAYGCGSLPKRYSTTPGAPRRSGHV